MADYTNSRKTNRGTYAERAVDAQAFTRVEPLLTVKQLKERILFGIGLTVKDPITKKLSTISDDVLQDLITSAVNQAEADLGIDIFAVQRIEPHPWDRSTFMKQGFLKVQHAPITSVDALSIRPNDGLPLYTIPLDWVSSAHFKNGQIYITPTAPTSASGFVTAYTNEGPGVAFLSFLSGISWTPNFWEIKYTTGFMDGTIPRIVNDLIGCYVGKEILGMLAATDTSTSRSLGMDGMNQSVSTGGPDRYNTRIQMFEDKRIALIGKLKAFFGRKFLLSNI